MARSRRARTRKRSRRKRRGGYKPSCPQGWHVASGSSSQSGTCVAGGGVKKSRKGSRKKRRGGQRVPSDCVRIKMPGMFGSLLKLDGEGQHASCPALPDGRTQNCMMIEPNGQPGDVCASAAARRALKLNNDTPATIVGKCMPGYKCGRASWSAFGGRKRRKTKRKKRGGVQLWWDH